MVWGLVAAAWVEAATADLDASAVLGCVRWGRKGKSAKVKGKSIYLFISLFARKKRTKERAPRHLSRRWRDTLRLLEAFQAVREVAKLRRLAFLECSCGARLRERGKKR